MKTQIDQEANMHKITRIGIQGFRRLQDVNIEMHPFSVMIGANGVGKTSVLDALMLLSGIAEGKLSAMLSSYGGFSANLTRNRSKSIGFQAEMSVEGFPSLLYTIELQQSGQTYAISEEKLTQQFPDYADPLLHITAQYDRIHYFDPERKKLIRTESDHIYTESALSQVDRMYPASFKLRDNLRDFVKYHFLNVVENAPVKLPQVLRHVDFPGANGETLLPFLYNLRETNPNRFEAIEDALKSAFPGLKQLGFPASAQGTISLAWNEKQFGSTMYADQLSEGTLRFLWLASLLQSPRLPLVTMIDEPEVSLHPELLGLLADLLREASNRTQIIVATHSDRFIRFLKPEEVLVLDTNEDGSASIERADTMDLDQWLREYSLDEIWQMGRLGGRS